MVDVQAAFRAGLSGQAFASARHEARAGFPVIDGLNDNDNAGRALVGGNGALAGELRRLPGLSEPRSAFATGRAVRKILSLFDQADAPPIIGRQFIDNLRAATLAQGGRPATDPWGAGDTVAMFMEMYGRVLGDGGRDYARTEAHLLADALRDPGQGHAEGGGLLGALRRIGRAA